MKVFKIFDFAICNFEISNFANLDFCVLPRSARPGAGEAAKKILCDLCETPGLTASQTCTSVHIRAFYDKNLVL